MLIIYSEQQKEKLLNMIDPDDKNEQFYSVDDSNIDNTNIPGSISSNQSNSNTKTEGSGYQK